MITKISKIFKQSLFAVCTILLATAAASCSNDDDNSVKLSFNPSSVSLFAGSSADVKVAGGSGNYTVKSSNDAVAKATVAQSTVTVTGVKAGKVMLFVTDATNKVSKTLSVTVNDKVSALSLDKTSVSCAVGTNTEIAVKNGTAPYTATSSNEKVAKATVSGSTVTVTSVAAGTATITVKDKNGLSGTISVIVK